MFGVVFRKVSHWISHIGASVWAFGVWPRWEHRARPEPNHDGVDNSVAAASQDLNVPLHSASEENIDQDPDADRDDMLVAGQEDVDLNQPSAHDDMSFNVATSDQDNIHLNQVAGLDEIDIESRVATMLDEHQGATPYDSLPYSTQASLEDDSVENCSPRVLLAQFAYRLPPERIASLDISGGINCLCWSDFMLEPNLITETV